MGRTLAWMNSSTLPSENWPRRRGPWPCLDKHSNVLISSSLLKKTSTPSPYILTRTFRACAPLFELHFISYTSFVIAPVNRLTCSASSMSSILSPQSDATDLSSFFNSSGKWPFVNPFDFIAILCAGFGSSETEIVCV